MLLVMQREATFVLCLVWISVLGDVLFLAALNSSALLD